MFDFKFYKDLLDNAFIGYALHKIILDKEGTPEDYEFIEVNTEFEKLTGLKSKDILKRKITEILPEIKKSKFNWIEYYGYIALNGGEKEFEQYSEPLKQWFRVKTYSPEKYYFLTIFNNISREKIISETSRLFLEQTSDVLDYQKICDNLLSISNAKYAALNIFEPDSRDFTTIALSGLAEHLNKAVDFLGFQLINKKWKHDPVRAKKIEKSIITRFKSLCELTGESILENIVKAITKTFRIGETAVLKISKGSIELGDFTIFMPEGEKLKNDSLLEIYAQQVGLIIDRNLSIVREKHTEDLLQKNLETINMILNIVPQSIFWKDLNGNYLGCNSVFASAVGIDDPSKVIGLNDFDLPWPEEEAAKYIKDDQQVIETNTPKLHIIEPLQQKDGKRLWIDTSKLPLRDKSGTPFGVLGVYNDITEERNSLQKLKESEEQFRKLFHSNNAVMLLINPETGNIVDANQAAHRFYGYSADELCRMSIKQINTLPESELAYKRKLAVDGKVNYFQFKHRMADGEIKDVEVYSTPVISANRELLFSIIHDITDRIKAQQALEKSEKRYHELINNLPGIIYEFSNRDGALFWSNQVEAIFGYLPQQLLDDPFIWNKSIHPDDRPVVDAAVSDINSTSNFNIDYRIKRSDGGWVWLNDRIFHKVILEDQIIIYGYAVDITDKKNYELNLLNQSKYLEAILQTTIDGFWVVDNSRRLTQVNEAFCNMTGYTRDELLSMNINDIDADEDIEETQARIQRIIQNGYELFETRHRCKNGKILDVEVSVTFINSEGGRLVCFGRDITERKHSENQLLEERKRLAGVIEGTNAGTWEWNIQTGQTVFNERWAEIIGYTLEEISPVSIQTWIDFAHPEDLAESNKLIKKHINGELDYYEFESRMKHKEGNWVWVLDRGKIITRTAEGKPLVMMGTHQKISKRKKAEEEKYRLQEQLAQSQKLESVGRLAGGVAHDFNNMLGVIIGHTEMIMEEVDDTLPIHQDLTEILKAANHSASLTKQLLAFARKQTAVAKVLNLNDAVLSLSTILRRLIGENIKLDIDIAENLWKVKIDSTQIDQILTNLCLNARDSIDAFGSITIKTENFSTSLTDFKSGYDFIPGEYVLISVKDTGCGMSAEILAKLFEPFFTTKKIGEGTGLGLPTVYGIVKQNNGFIDVESAVGSGSVFKIYLPRHSGEEPQIEKAEGKSKSDHGNETILIVEDEPAILNLAAAILGRLGYNIITAPSPGKALETADKTGSIKLLISDVIMPEMNGQDLSVKLKEKFPHMKCLFMSGYTSDIISRQGIVGSELNFIQKPFSVRDLSEKVKNIINSADQGL